MNIYLLADATSNALGGFSVLVVAVLGLIGLFLVLCWIALPFIIISNFHELLKIEGDALKILQKQADAQNETNKALQYLIDSAAASQALQLERKSSFADTR